MKKLNQQTVVGAGLLAAGAVMMAIGGGQELSDIKLVLVVLGAGLVAAGSTLVLGAASLSHSQEMVVGSVLATTGVATAVLAARAGLGEVRLAVVSVGGAIFIAGLIELVTGALSAGMELGKQ